MLRRRWWCDWYLSPSEGEYFREDEIFFFQLAMLIPFVSMLLSWPWFDHLSLFPCWFNTLSAILLTSVCLALSSYRHLFWSPIRWFIKILLYLEMYWYILVLFVGMLADPKVVSELTVTLEYPWSILSEWYEPLWWSLLRDGPYFIIVLSSVVSLHSSHLSYSSISDESFDEYQLFNFSFRPRQQRRRSPFVMHYVLLRKGHIRRRIQKRFGKENCNSFGSCSL